MENRKCKSCGYNGIRRFLELGKMPPVNAFIRYSEIENEESYPLNLSYCPICFLVQLEECVSPYKLFRNYNHLSSGSKPNIDHLKSVADYLSRRFSVDSKTKILEIGSNDGTLLSFFKNYTENILGVDPAKNLIEINKKKGIDYLAEFFNTDTASEILKKRGKFDMLVALNVIPHTPDNIDLLKGARMLLKDSGILVMEGVYAIETILSGQFDTIYHEHVYTFSFHSLIKTFLMAGLTIVDVEKIPTQGGSLRIFAMKSEHSVPLSNSVSNLLEEEERAGLTNPKTYEKIEEIIKEYRKKLREVVYQEKTAHGKLIGLGAPARGIVLLNYCGLNAEDIEFLADDTLLKQNKVAPGVHIPVGSWNDVEKSDKRTYLLLSWNYRDHFISRLKEVHSSFRVIIPFPNLEVIEIG